MLALFLTLFGRLWYLQVFSGDDYQAKAADQSVREIVVQPARGLIVDDMGRPLVANRTSWVVTVDRTHAAAGWTRPRRTAAAPASREAVHTPYGKIQARTLLCGEPDSVRGVCWNGSPYQPVPVAEDIQQQTALSIMEQNEDFPAVIVEAQNVRAYPSPYGINAAHLLGYLSPITEGELDAGRGRPRTSSVHGASVVGRAGLEKEYDRYLRGFPGYKKVAVDSMGRVLGDSGEIEGRVGDTLVTSIDARVQAVVEQQLLQTIKTARQTYDTVTGTELRRRLRARSWCWTPTTGDVVAMASQPTYDPKVWVGGITEKQLARLYSDRRPARRCSPARPRAQFAPGSTWKPFMTAGALENGYAPATPAATARRRSRSATGVFKNYESGVLRLHRLPEGARGLVQHLLLPGRFRLLAAVRHATSTDVEAQDPLVETAQMFGFGKETGIDLPGEATGRIADRSVEARLLRGQEGLLLRGRQGAPGLATSSTGSPASSASRASPTAPATRSTSRSARATRSSPRCSWPAATPRSPTAAPCTSRGSARRSSTRTATWSSGSSPACSAQSRSSKADLAVHRQRPARHARRPARWPGGSSTSRSTRCRSAPRPALPRSTASRAPRGSRPTPRTTSW